MAYKIKNLNKTVLYLAVENEYIEIIESLTKKDNLDPNITSINRCILNEI